MLRSWYELLTGEVEPIVVLDPYGEDPDLLSVCRDLVEYAKTVAGAASEFPCGTIGPWGTLQRLPIASFCLWVEQQLLLDGLLQEPEMAAVNPFKVAMNHRGVQEKVTSPSAHRL
jgi:hypothetical protein